MEANDLPLMGSMPGGVQPAPAYLVAQCRDYTQAVALCMDLDNAHRSRREWASLLDMSLGTLSQILNQSGRRVRYFPPNLFSLVQAQAGNTAINQFFAMELAGELNHQNERLEEINSLKQRLAVLEGRK